MFMTNLLISRQLSVFVVTLSMCRRVTSSLNEYVNEFTFDDEAHGDSSSFTLTLFRSTPPALVEDTQHNDTLTRESGLLHIAFHIQHTRIRHIIFICPVNMTLI